MKRNGAILVALIVVAVAAALMYFVVLPQVSSKKGEELAKQAGDVLQSAKDAIVPPADTVADAAKSSPDANTSSADAAKTAADADKPASAADNTAAEVAADPKRAILHKMARLKADGIQAAIEFEALFAGNSQPTLEQIEAVRARLEAALTGAADLGAKDGLDPETVATIEAMSKGARQALAGLQAMPKDAAGAKSTFLSLKPGLLAALDGKLTLPSTADTSTAQTTPALEQLPADQTATEQQPAEQAASADSAAAPSFDVLRVEKDGSTVIAGRAAPNSHIDILDGDKVIASAEAGDRGDFVAVLDNPLPAGDHQMVLRATGKDGKTVNSVETALVSVPKDKSGELLAMVTKPGEASRIMAMPTAAKESVVGDSDAGKAATPAETSQVAAADDTKPAASQETSAKMPDDAAAQDTAADKPVVTPDLPDASADIANSAPQVTQQTEASQPNAAAKPQDQAEPAKTAEAQGAADQAATPADKQAATQDVASAKPGAGEVAAADGTVDTSVLSDAKAPTKTLSAPEVLVNAVEIEGDKLFVAGSARPRSTVRVYADNLLVAEVRTDENGRFVADNQLRLAVGNHTIRADVVSRDGKRVEFRASVPFFRPEGEQLAAVSSQPTTADAKKMQPLADGEYDKARREAGKAVSLLKDLYNAGRTPTLEELAAARSSTEIALKTLSQIRLSDSDNKEATEIANKTAGKAANALKLLKSLPQDAGAIKLALNSIDDAVTSAVAPAMDRLAAKSAKDGKSAQPVEKPATASAEADQVARADSSMPAADQTADVASNTDAASNTGAAAKADTAAAQATPDNTVAAADTDQPKIIEQAPLQASQAASVIIRRGDTLWQISRRVYGMGVRYTTIYVANEAQISDPDRIMPGQTFGVPTQYLPNSEDLHRQRLRHKHDKN